MGAIVSAETGKVRLESVLEALEGIDLIEAYCGHMERNDGYVIPLGQLSHPTVRSSSAIRSPSLPHAGRGAGSPRRSGARRA